MLTLSSIADIFQSHQQEHGTPDLLDRKTERTPETGREHTDRKQRGAMGMADYYIVWNEGRTEGFITDSREDANQTRSGKFRNPYTSAGEAFHECYSEEDLGLQRIDVDPIPQA